MSRVMISLIGEQPIPNLLPIRHDSPNQVVLAYTERVQQVSERLEELLRKSLQVYPLQVSPFDIPSTKNKLEQFITHQGWKPSQLVFNLTGGTKAMAFAAYRLAEEWRCPFIYVVSEEIESRVYRYRFDEKGTALLEQEEVIPGVISLDDYLKAHLGAYYSRGFAQTEGGRFEEILYQALKPVVDEILVGVQLGGAGDLDLVLRCANQVGIAEVKAGVITKDAIEQLNIAGARERLGIYTKKVLIVGTLEDHTRSNLRELAEASEIKVITLPNYAQTKSLSDQDRQQLVREIAEALRCW